jgi:acetyltransferase-like isoleucine patch superfamily enzyme
VTDGDRIEGLRRDLQDLGRRLRDETYARHRRFNPVSEDLADWQERGRAWLGEDRGVTVYDSSTLIGDVAIGDGTWVGPFTLLDGSGGLVIGHHCSISTGAQLLSHDTVAWALSGGRAATEHSPTIIGDCCFIGTHAIVVRGVSIGDQCLVAAGAVVVEDVAPRSIVAGVPAQVIGRVETAADGDVTLHYDVSSDAP